jgi:hypothetical protein
MTPTRLSEWTLVAAVNNDKVLTQTLLASPAIDGHCQIVLKRGFPSAGQAYNAGLAEANNEVVVFAHQDVYLPSSWLGKVETALSVVESNDPNWGVLGVFGVSKSDNCSKQGHCYSTGLQRILGAPLERPIETRSLDELVLIVRRSSRLSFDEALPGFHLYGTDICLSAESHRMRSYIISAFCVHNSNGIEYLPMEFWRAQVYLQRKWKERLPIETCCTTIKAGWLPTVWPIARAAADRVCGLRKVGRRCVDVQQLYSSLVREYGVR